MSLVLLLLVAAALAFFNGANDNIKGAATLVGSGLMSPRRALVWATLATAAGGLLSILLAGGLLAAFGGRGLVPDALAGSVELLLPAGIAAAVTVALATRLRLPVSTTHALVGSLIGVAMVAAPGQLRLLAAFGTLAAPLLLVPVIAIVLALLSIPLLRRLQARLAPLPELCLCETPAMTPGNGPIGASRMAVRSGVLASNDCGDDEAMLRFAPAQTLDRMHLLTAMSVSFARGLNDTPKLAAIALAAGFVGGAGSSLLVILAMAAGGLLAGYRVADTMAWRVTRMAPVEGFGGNLVAAALILAASPLGLPVSTTHVTCGALFGIAATNHSGDARTIGSIALAWLLTLPLAAGLAALAHTLLASG